MASTKSTSPQRRITRLESKVTRLSNAVGKLELKLQGLPKSLLMERLDALLGKKPKTPVRPAKTRPLISRTGRTAAPKTGPTGLDAALARGEAARLAWVQDGEVVPAKVLAQHWGLTPQALGPAAERGEVFALVVKRQRYFPKEFLSLTREAVSTVCKALGPLTPEEKLIFWKRPHGSLGNRSVGQALSSAKDPVQLERVRRLAQAWVNEAHSAEDVAAAA